MYGQCRMSMTSEININGKCNLAFTGGWQKTKIRRIQLQQSGLINNYNSRLFRKAVHFTIHMLASKRDHCIPTLTLIQTQSNLLNQILVQGYLCLTLTVSQDVSHSVQYRQTVHECSLITTLASINWWISNLAFHAKILMSGSKNLMVVKMLMLMLQNKTSPILLLWLQYTVHLHLTIYELYTWKTTQIWTHTFTDAHKTYTTDQLYNKL